MASIVRVDGTEAEIDRGSRITEREIEWLRRNGALIMKQQGLPLRLIARYFGVTRETIRNWIKSLPAEGQPVSAVRGSNDVGRLRPVG